jgi:hypothetical protein
MWSGVKKAMFGSSKNDGLNIQQLNGKEEKKISQARQSQDEWDDVGNKFESLDKNLSQQNSQKKCGGEKLRTPSLMFWRSTEDEAESSPQKQTLRKTSFSLWSQTSSCSIDDVGDAETRETVQRGNSSLSFWRNNSETEEKNFKKSIPRKSSSILSWQPSSEFSPTENTPAAEVECAAEEDAKDTKGGKKHLRRKSSLLAKLRGLDLEPEGDTSAESSPPKDECHTEVIRGEEGEDAMGKKGVEYSERMLSLLSRIRSSGSGAHAAETKTSPDAPTPPSPNGLQDAPMPPPDELQ